MSERGMNCFEMQETMINLRIKANRQQLTQLIEYGIACLQERNVRLENELAMKDHTHF